MKDGSNIIQGPWESSEKDTEVKKKIEDDMNFIEELTEKIMVQLIHTMSENQIDIKNKNLAERLVF